MWLNQPVSKLARKVLCKHLFLLIPPLLAEHLTPKQYPTDSIPRSGHCRSRVRQLSPMGEKQTTQPTCCAANHGMRSKTQVTKYTTYNQTWHCKPRILYKYVHINYINVRYDMSHMMGRLWLHHASCSDWTVTFLELGKLMLFGFENGGLEKEENEMLKRGANVEKKTQNYLTIAARSITSSLLWEKHPMLQSGRHRSTSFNEESKELCECSILRSFMVIGWIT